MREDCTVEAGPGEEHHGHRPVDPAQLLHASDSMPEPITAVMICAIAVHNVPGRVESSRGRYRNANLMSCGVDHMGWEDDGLDRRIRIQ
jgi:hypothetical protein